MKKRLIAFLLLSFIINFSFISAYASQIVNGISFYVNGEPVTLYQLHKMTKIAQVNKEEAMEILINERLQDEEALKYNILISEREVDDEIQALSNKNGQNSIEALKRTLIQQGIDFNHYRDDIKKRLLQKKLFSAVVSENIELADENELKEYYNAHKQDFVLPTHVNIIRYGSHSQNVLDKMVRKKYPIGSIPPAPSGASSAPERIEIARLNPQLVSLLISVPVGGFTPVFNIAGEFVTFFVVSKIGGAPIPFEESKRAIFGKIMLEREEKILQEHFEKLRAAAKIKIVRLD